MSVLAGARPGSAPKFLIKYCEEDRGALGSAEGRSSRPQQTLHPTGAVKPPSFHSLIFPKRWQLGWLSAE